MVFFVFCGAIFLLLTIFNLTIITFTGGRIPIVNIYFLEFLLRLVVLSFLRRLTMRENRSELLGNCQLRMRPGLGKIRPHGLGLQSYSFSPPTSLGAIDDVLKLSEGHLEKMETLLNFLAPALDWAGSDLAARSSQETEDEEEPEH